MRTALQFSGGKDSLALLFHLEALLPFIDVVMLNTQDMTEAAYENSQTARAMSPNFYVINTFPNDYRKIYGDPTSQNWVSCCNKNIWAPMQNFIHQKGYKQIFRGTKRCDPYLHAVYPGDVVDGVIYTMPLWEWSDEDIKGYLKDKLPKPYQDGAKGMPDCVSCPVPESCGGRTREMWK